MKKTLCFCLLLSGCATLNSQNEFYHRFAAKPSIVEKDLGNNKRLETLENPYDVAIVATVDCDNEAMKRILTVKSSSSVSFNTYSDTNYNCSVTKWETK